MPENKDLLQHMENALDEIDNNLHQMLILAELSASDLDLDRAALQRSLERLRGRIDAIADTLG